MKLISTSILKKEYWINRPNLSIKKKLFKQLKPGYIAHYTQTRFAMGHNIVSFVFRQKFFSFREEYVTRGKGILISKSSKTANIICNFRGFFFFKMFNLEAPNLLGLYTEKHSTFLPFKRIRNNLTSIIYPKHSFFKKLKKFK